MTGDDGGVDVKQDDPVPPDELPPNERVAYMRGQREKEDEVRDLLNDLEPCDHPIEEYVEYQGFWDKCPRCGETIEADIHSLFVELRRRLDEVDDL